MSILHSSPRAGNVAVTAVIGLVVIAAVAGIGAYVLHQQQPTAASKTSAQTTAQTAGTTSDIDTLTQADTSGEAAIDTGADTQAQTDAASSNNAVSHIGGAYNESNL